ncbi:MAG: hypothetical protein AAF772_07370 [Acidobacteriota bacterium]
MNEFVHTATYVTAWLALALYPAGPLAARRGRLDRRWQSTARWLYTLGGLIFGVHVLCAYEAFYAWSHAIALRETAAQTEAVTGVASGAGLYLNFVFTALWTIDLLHWWTGRGLDRSHRPPRWLIPLHAFQLFMIFNAAVVFAAGAARWLAAAAFAALVAALAAGLRPRAATTEPIHTPGMPRAAPTPQRDDRAPAPPPQGDDSADARGTVEAIRSPPTIGPQPPSIPSPADAAPGAATRDPAS